MRSASELIVAAATPVGPGMRAIVRLAGVGLSDTLARLFEPDPPGFAASGDAPRLVTARLATPGLGLGWGPLPVEIVHWPGPAGPIGGPLAEVQLPGSTPLVAALIDEACRHGCRIARGGEFTLRAFLAGRLDLVQAEAVLAVIDATTPEQLSAALDRMAAGAGGRLTRVHSDLLDLVADVEAAIDFADESTPDAVPAGPDWHGLTARVTACDAALAAVAERLADRAPATAGLPRVVLVGPPNIGKSSLFNALVGHAAALVADEVGTTRDWLEALLGDAVGPRCVLVDLAGLQAASHPAGDTVVGDALDRARWQLRRADLVVSCRDAGDAERAELPAETPRIDVVTRCDRVDHVPSGPLPTSSLTGVGVDRLRAGILAAVAALPARAPAATERLASGCAAARRALAGAMQTAIAASAGAAVDESILAGHLRRAAEELAEVTGATIDADLLDRIFSRHCIGK